MTGLQWHRDVAAYVDDSWRTVDYLLATTMYPYDPDVRLEPSAGCALLTIGGSCSLVWAHKRDSVTRSDTAVRADWMDWVTHVLEDPTIIRPAAGGLDGYGQWVPEWVDTESDPNVDLSAEPRAVRAATLRVSLCGSLWKRRWTESTRRSRRCQTCLKRT